MNILSVFKRRREAAVETSSRVSAHHWTICDASVSDDQPVAAYARQLVDEGYARLHLDAFVIEWPDVYRLLANPEHENSQWLLALPALSTLRPSLVSRGSPTELDFSVSVTGWLDANGRNQDGVEVTGAIVAHNDYDFLLPQPAYALLEALKDLAFGAGDASPQRRRITLGRIKALANYAGAHQDAYLMSTDVVVPDQITVTLQETETLGVPVVQIRPGFDQQPKRWDETFDKYSSAQHQYDFARNDGGTTHVMLPEAVYETLKAIKHHAPGGRLASTQAEEFLRNPYPYLNDGAEAVLPVAEFEAAKRRSGIVDRDLVASPAETGFDLIFLDPIGQADDAVAALFDPASARKLWSAASEARLAGRTSFRWKRHNVLFGGSTDSSLRTIGEWLALESTEHALVHCDDVFDLRAYSDRVVGFDGRPIHVPVITKDRDGKSWIQDIQIISTSPDKSEPKVTRLSDDAVQNLRKQVERAKADNRDVVRIEELGETIPVEEAQAWLEALARKRAGDHSLPKPKDPLPRSTASLKILHNIEHLDYGKAEEATSHAPQQPVLPKALRDGIELKPHQLEGLGWLQGHVLEPRPGVRGVLLADDMGLGKTLQCLALMAWYRETAEHPRPCLIVAPVSLLENWKAEIAKFLDGTQGETLALYGRTLAEHRLPADSFDNELRASGVRKLLKPNFARSAAFVLTTYETLRDYELSLGREAWGIFVCDEAQKIKTPGALVTRSAKAMNAEFRVACTGTPVENSLADLWCLFDFFRPAMLGSLAEFTRTYRQAIEQADTDRGVLVDELRGKIEPFVLRRMKAEVADLPDKINEYHHAFDPTSNRIGMSMLQRSLYRSAIEAFKEAMERAKDDSKGNTTALALIHKLRMICANPLAVADDRAELRPVKEHIEHSPKLRWVLAYLEQVKAAGEKAILFSEYRDVQRLLQRAVASRFAFSPVIVNGDTSVDVAKDDARQALIDRFQASEGFGVIVLSTTAVGFGVNIQAANHVIHFTRPWNPAKEDQATDRAYRIGSTKPVWVYCPTVVGDSFESYEQRLASRLAEKRSLSEDMLAPKVDVGLKDFGDLS